MSDDMNFVLKPKYSNFIKIIDNYEIEDKISINSNKSNKSNK